MSKIDVTTDFSPFDFGATDEKEILQNVRMIMNTITCSCPLNREFGWSDAIDGPVNIAQAKISQRIVAAINKYEPRARVIKITFQGGQNGLLKPIVRVSINEQ
jgi:phage baseplate assembly protein W